MKRLIHSILVLIIMSINGYSQTVRDSFDQLILTAPHDSLKIDYIIEAIHSSVIKTKKDLNQYLELGVNVVSESESIDRILRLRLTHARNMAIVGEIVEAKKYYKILNELAIRYDNLTYIALVLQGEATFNAQEGEIDLALNKLFKAVEILRKGKNNIRKAGPYNQLGTILRDQGRYREAQLYLDTVIHLTKMDSMSTQLSSAFSSKGRIYRFQGKNDSAALMYKQAEKYSLINKNQFSLAVIYNNLGNIEHVAGRYDQALAYYLKSMKIKEGLNDFRGTTIAYHNIGAIMVEMEEWDKALGYFNKSNRKAEEIKFRSLVVHNENKIGEVVRNQNRIDTAIFHHKKALKIAEDISFKKGVVTSLLNLGVDYLQLKDYKNCNTYLIKALNLSKKINSKSQESAILVKLSESFINAEQEIRLGKRETENLGISFSDVKSYLLDAYRMAGETNNAQNKLLALEGLDLFYKKRPDSKAHIDILQEYISLKDTLFANDRMDALANWETKYETAEKEKEILQLESKNQIEKLKNQQFRYLMLGLFIFFSLAAWYSYYYLKNQNRKKQLKQRELFRSKLSSDLHDDVGTILTGLAMQSELLTNFVADNMKPKLENIAVMSRDAMDRMRDTVWAIDSRKDKVDDLLGRIQDFGSKHLLSKDINFKFDSSMPEKDRKIEPELRQNMYLIFKECIANILKHSNASEVISSLQVQSNRMILSVYDNGTTASKEINSSGIGLSSISDRAKKLKGTMDINSQEGFEILVSVPL